MSRFRLAAAVVAALLLVPGAARAQPPHGIRQALVRAVTNDARAAGPRTLSSIRWPASVRLDGERQERRALSGAARQKDARRDPVGNGVAIGALTGALTGAGLTALMTTQCNGRCDDPSLSTALLVTTAVGAAVGALIGLAIDRAR